MPKGSEEKKERESAKEYKHDNEEMQPYSKMELLGCISRLLCSKTHMRADKERGAKVSSKGSLFLS